MQIPFETIKTLKQGRALYRAIDHPFRRKMLEMLETETSVTDLYCTLRIEQSVCSQHLAILRKAGLVAFERNGKRFMYRTVTARIIQLAIAAESLLSSVNSFSKDSEKQWIVFQ